MDRRNSLLFSDFGDKSELRKLEFKGCTTNILSIHGKCLEKRQKAYLSLSRKKRRKKNAI